MEVFICFLQDEFEIFAADNVVAYKERQNRQRQVKEAQTLLLIPASYPYAPLFNLRVRYAWYFLRTEETSIFGIGAEKCLREGALLLTSTCANVLHKSESNHRRGKDCSIYIISYFAPRCSVQMDGKHKRDCPQATQRLPPFALMFYINRMHANPIPVETAPRINWDRNGK